MTRETLASDPSARHVGVSPDVGMPVPESVLVTGRPRELSAVVRVQPLLDAVVTVKSAREKSVPSRKISVVRKMEAKQGKAGIVSNTGSQEKAELRDFRQRKSVFDYFCLT